MQIELFVIPKDPQFSPSATSVQVATKLIEDFAPLNNGVRVTTSMHPKICGNLYPKGNRLTCPSCSKVLDLGADELDQWWSDFQDRIFGADDPLNELFKMPCCENEVKGNRFDFGGGVHYSKFIASIDDPIDGDQLTQEQLDALEAVLGCELIQFDSFDT